MAASRSACSAGPGPPSARDVVPDRQDAGVTDDAREARLAHSTSRWRPVPGQDRVGDLAAPLLGQRLEERITGAGPLARWDDGGEPVLIPHLVRAAAGDPPQERIDADDPSRRSSTSTIAWAVAINPRRSRARASPLLRPPPLGDVFTVPTCRSPPLHRRGAGPCGHGPSGPSPRPDRRYSIENSSPAARTGPLLHQRAWSSGWMNRDQPSPRASAESNP